MITISEIRSHAGDTGVLSSDLRSIQAPGDRAVSAGQAALEAHEAVTSHKSRLVRVSHDVAGVDAVSFGDVRVPGPSGHQPHRHEAAVWAEDTGLQLQSRLKIGYFRRKSSSFKHL